MSTTVERLEVTELQRELTAFRHNWLWFVLLGATLTGVGALTLGSVVLASLATAVVIGALLLAGGMAETLGAFWCGSWSSTFLHVLSGALSIVVGVFFVWAPVDAQLTLTLLLACLLTASGVFKIAAALLDWSENWGWLLVCGIIDLTLGALIFMEWPGSGLWVLGLFVGITLVFRGFNWIGLGMALRRRNERLDGLVRLRSTRPEENAGAMASK